MLKSSDDDALQEAAQWVEGALEEISSRESLSSIPERPG